jgi:hypothetical protein
MARRRRVIGSVCKTKEPGKSPYLKISGDVTLRQGQYVNLESAKAQLASLEEAVKNGKLSEDIAEKARERISKIPDFVLFEASVTENT